MAEGSSARHTLRNLLVALLGLAGLGVILLVPGPGASVGVGPPGSTYATSEEGTKAPLLLLERLGHRTEQRTQPLGDLGATRLAFVIAPEGRLDRIDGEGLRAWLTGGGTLVYGVSAFEPMAEPLRHALELPLLMVRPVAGEAELEDDWAPARTLAIHLAVSPLTEVVGEGERLTSFARRSDNPAALVLTRGQGRVYLLDARVLSNDGLKHGDNALFLAALAARHAGDRPIAFDEYVHGHGETPSLLAVTAWPLEVGLGVAGLAFVVYGLAIGRRLGAPSPEPAPPRRASIEQIEALGAFFAAHHDRETAIAALADFTGAARPAVLPKDDRGLLEAARRLLAPTPRPRP